MNAKPTDCEGAFEAANMELFDLNQFQVLLRGSVLAKPKDRDPKIFGLNTLHVACTKNDRTISLGINWIGVGIEMYRVYSIYHHRAYRSWSILYGGDPL